MKNRIHLRVIRSTPKPPESATRIRARTVPMPRKLSYLPADYPEGAERPETRGDCVNGPRPCPWVGCRFNLYLDVRPHGVSLKMNRPHLEPDEVPPGLSCALDVADRGGSTLDEVAEALGGGLTRERVRQIETVALEKLKVRARELKPFLETEPVQWLPEDEG